jgi:hypothetical protein
MKQPCRHVVIIIVIIIIIIIIGVNNDDDYNYNNNFAWGSLAVMLWRMALCWHRSHVVAYGVVLAQKVPDIFLPRPCAVCAWHPSRYHHYHYYYLL